MHIMCMSIISTIKIIGSDTMFIIIIDIDRYDDKDRCGGLFLIIIAFVIINNPFFLST